MFASATSSHAVLSRVVNGEGLPYRSSAGRPRVEQAVLRPLPLPAGGFDRTGIRLRVETSSRERTRAPAARGRRPILRDF
ncbi:MAG TPA: hypothetical protein VMG12_30465 [Polyangiaceae bacterium]|nr:hypothetical protein [Polyangiaceae bacterium]